VTVLPSGAESTCCNLTARIQQAPAHVQSASITARAHAAQHLDHATPHLDPARRAEFLTGVEAGVRLAHTLIPTWAELYADPQPSSFSSLSSTSNAAEQHDQAVVDAVAKHMAGPS
jgi:hypothetical protein